MLFDSGTPNNTTLASVTVTDDTGSMNPTAASDYAEDEVTLTFPRDLVQLLNPATWEVEPDAFAFDDDGILDPPYTGEVEQP